LFKENTVFVVGAGANAEFGLPVGVDLAKTIARLMRFDINPGISFNGDRSILEIFKHNSNRDQKVLDEHLKAAKSISEGIPHINSIDNYLNNHSDDEKIIFCGKTAIVKAILDAEKKATSIIILKQILK